MEAKQTGAEEPDAAFAKRLERLRAAGAAVHSQEPEQQQQSNMIDIGRPQYDSPPPLSKTLFGAGSDDGAGSDGSSFGWPQVLACAWWLHAAASSHEMRKLSKGSSVVELGWIPDHMRVSSLTHLVLPMFVPMVCLSGGSGCRITGVGGYNRGVQRQQRRGAEQPAAAGCGSGRATAWPGDAQGSAGAGSALRGTPCGGT